MRQNRELLIDTQIWSTDLRQRCQSNSMRKGTSLKKMGLEQMDIHLKENESQSLHYNILKII